MVTIQLTNADLNRFQRDINRYDDQSKRGIQRETFRAANNITNQAKSSAPRATSVLAGSLRMIPSADRFSATSGTNIEYAPYVEFGTGSGVSSYPFFGRIDGLREYAMQFKGKGIRRVNRRPKPYLFKAMFYETPKYLERLKRVLNNG